METTKLITFLFSVFLVFSTCDDDDNNGLPDNSSPDTDGIAYVATTEIPSTVYNAIISILNANDNIGIVAEVNHSENASNAGLTLDFTRTIFFGNPALGTPLMQDNIQAGLDLPQRITVYVDEDGDTVVAYNSVDYVVNRHNLGDVATTETIANALANIVHSATGEDVILNPVDTDDPAGIITVTSPNDFDTTYDQILNTLHSLEPITVMAELDHQANAAGVDMFLMPAKLIIFGNPALGTPLMQESRTVALDLPQKMLVYENANGDVKIIYNDPYQMADRHDIDDNTGNLELISNALQNIADSGAAE
ncbi:DUF302 domain-containing protein [Arenibacter certesii]|uniref:DUF302 domain-containing protein n=1 Tax=Arenibacter certesii TaxID=228955 RepID=A0A918J2I4_9FLAO|nr:DUF302 domain-containing protein [Arenibacter certesii]GGW44455.1 hypothetical protein GCM10007383_31130 [Arenibacter certesii]